MAAALTKVHRPRNPADYERLRHIFGTVHTERTTNVYVWLPILRAPALQRATAGTRRQPSLSPGQRFSVPKCSSRTQPCCCPHKTPWLQQVCYPALARERNKGLCVSSMKGCWTKLTRATLDNFTLQTAQSKAYEELEPLCLGLDGFGRGIQFNFTRSSGREGS